LCTWDQAAPATATGAATLGVGAGVLGTAAGEDAVVPFDEATGAGDAESVPLVEQPLSATAMTPATIAGRVLATLMSRISCPLTSERSWQARRRLAIAAPRDAVQARSP
jgi:hypothetical protein